MTNLKTLFSIALFGAILCLSACFRPDIRTVDYDVPAMGTTECVQIIQNALGAVDGILSARPDLQSHSIAVTYDSRKLSIKNIEFVISGSGFDVNDTQGRPEAKKALSADCR